MSQKLRLDAILEILQKQHYVSVKYLVDTLHYSNATINRDLNVLKQRNLINRSYGGVELITKSKLPALPFRYHIYSITRNLSLVIKNFYLRHLAAKYLSYRPP